MPDFAAMPHPERVLYLAGLETECPGGCSKGRQPMGLCQTCNGTGSVARCPMLRVPCHMPRKTDCDVCGNRGWVPVATPGALMEAADTYPDWSVGRMGPGEPVTAEVAGWPAEGVTPADALSLALCRKVEGEK